MPAPKDDPEKWKRKISEAKKGKTFSEKHKRKLSESHKGKILSEETKRKISKANKKYYAEHPEVREKISKTTKKYYAEHREQMSKIKKEYYIEHPDKNPMYGKHHSDATKRKISESHKGKILSEEHKRKIHEAKKDKPLSEKHKRKIGEAQKGDKHHLYGKHQSEKTKRKLSESHKGKHHSNATKLKMSEVTKKNWRNPNYIKKVLKARNAKPNKSERELTKLLNELHPNEWRYNGDFSQGITIGGRVPDWVNVNGKKQVIELFGEYWHSPLKNPKISSKRTYNETIKDYKKYGFDCLVIWDKELREKIKERL